MKTTTTNNKKQKNKFLMVMKKRGRSIYTDLHCIEMILVDAPLYQY